MSSKHLVGRRVIVAEDVEIYAGEEGTAVAWLEREGKFVVRLDDSGLCEFWPLELEFEEAQPSKAS